MRKGSLTAAVCIGWTISKVLTPLPSPPERASAVSVMSAEHNGSKFRWGAGEDAPPLGDRVSGVNDANDVKI